MNYNLQAMRTDATYTSTGYWKNKIAISIILPPSHQNTNKIVTYAHSNFIPYSHLANSMNVLIKEEHLKITSKRSQSIYFWCFVSIFFKFIKRIFECKIESALSQHTQDYIIKWHYNESNTNERQTILFEFIAVVRWIAISKNPLRSMHSYSINIDLIFGSVRINVTRKWPEKHENYLISSTVAIHLYNIVRHCDSNEFIFMKRKVVHDVTGALNRCGIWTGLFFILPNQVCIRNLILFWYFFPFFCHKKIKFALDMFVLAHFS